MMTRLYSTLLLLFCLAVLHAPAARAADTNMHAYAIQEKDEVTSILTEPVRGRETRGLGPGMCVLATGETRQADNGQTWMEVTQPALGWIPAQNAGAPNPECEAAFQVLDTLYQTLYFAAERHCLEGEYSSLKDVPEIRDWLKAHSAPVIAYGVWNKSPDTKDKNLDQALDDILGMFEYLPAYRPDCSDVPREEFFTYFQSVITDKPGTFHFMMRENLINQIRTLHFRMTPDGPVVSAVDYFHMI